MSKGIKTLFHKMAKEGKAITILRQKYAKEGIHISSDRADIILQLRKLKRIHQKDRKQ